MTLRRILCAASIAAVVLTGSLHGGEPKTIGDAQFEKLHQMLKPQLGESRWMEIDWYPSVWEEAALKQPTGRWRFLLLGWRPHCGHRYNRRHGLGCINDQRPAA